MALAIGFGSMLLALAVACPARAQDPSSESAWIPAGAAAPASSRPSSVPGPASHPAPAPSDNSSVAPEQGWFWDVLNDRVFSQWCRQVELPPGWDGRFGHFALAGAHLTRRLAPLPFGNGKLAIVDQVGLDVGVGQLNRRLAGDAEAALPVNVVARMEGNSIVVRPLASDRECEQLLRVPPKTVLPLDARRISQMQVGEIWKMPLRLDMTFTVTPQLHIPVPGAVPVTLAVSLTGGRQDTSQATLNRLDERTLRFRLHLDHATLKSVGGSVGTSLIPISRMPWPVTGDILAQNIGRPAAIQIQHYLTANLGLSADKRVGERAMVEYILDPADAAQMEALVQTLKGDLESLVNLGRKGTGPIWRDSDADPDLAKVLAQEHADVLGAAAGFSGADRYQDAHHGLSFRAPVLLSYTRSKQKAHDLDKVFGDGGRYDLYQVGQQSNRAMLDVPVLGQVYKRVNQRTAQVFAYQDGQGHGTAPEMIISQQAGFQNGSGRMVRRMLNNANSVFELAGTKGQGVNPATSLPVDKLLPETVAHYKMGALSDTLTFNQRAVQSILQSQPADVVRSYVRTLSQGTQEKMAWVLAHGQMGADGRLTYDAKALLHDPAIHAGLFSLWRIHRAAKAAALLAADLAAASQEASPDQQVKDLYRVLGGGGAAHLQLARVVKTFVELADPLGVAGEISLQLAPGGKHAKRTTQKYDFNPDAKDPLVNQLQQDRARFANPSLLSD